ASRAYRGTILFGPPSKMQMSEVATRERSVESLRRHYEVERELADRLRTASPRDRLHLYRTVYDDLFARVPDHPQLCRKVDSEWQQEVTARQLLLLRRFIRPDTTYLEIGAGDCHLSRKVASEVKQVYAVDVSEQVSGLNAPCSRLTLIISDGIRLVVPAESVDVAYSHQLIEHLHPEDAVEHLREVYAALAPGGVYVCTTPHRFSGPHDISKYFDREARGFHLKEYTFRELAALFERIGFADACARIGLRGRFLRLPHPLAIAIESGLGMLPLALRKWTARRFPFRALCDSVTIVGRKPAKP